MSSLLMVPLVKSETVLALSLVFGAVTIVGCMWTMLENVKDDSRMEPPPVKTQYITQDTEDALSLETLAKLSKHPNFSITEMSTKILTERAVFNDEVMKKLIKAVGSPDYERRLNSLRALCFVILRPYSYYKPMQTLITLRTHKIFARCLRHCVAAYHPSRPPLDHSKHFNEFNLRSEDEKLALDFLSHISQGRHILLLIEAGFVGNWLCKQNWGETREERQRQFAEYIVNKKNRVVDLIRCLQGHSAGVLALKRAGLQVSSRAAEVDSGQVRVYVPSGNRSWGGSQLRETGAGSSGVRGREQSEEEVRLRRQNRETMVVIDGPEPLDLEDLVGETDEENNGVTEGPARTGT